MAKYQVPAGLLLLEKRMKEVVREDKKRKGRFHMGNWGVFDNGAAKRIWNRIKNLRGNGVAVTPSEFNECGASACLAGHMTMIPEFRRKGLRLFVPKHDADEDWCSGIVAIVKDNRIVERDPPTLGMKFLGITAPEAQYLFLSDTAEVDPKRGLLKVQRLIDRYRRGEGGAQRAHARLDELI